MSEWKIRRINPESVSKGNFCAKGACCETATFYLVLMPEPNTFRLRESRMRRCEKHAKESARALRIAFPEENPTPHA